MAIRKEKVRQGSHYFKPLSNTILEYVDHPEHKFESDTRILERKHIDIDGSVYIGKKANDIDEQELDVVKPHKFINKQEIMDNILKTSQKQAEKLGVSRRRFQGVKQRIWILI